jgi:AcrR family transcriptional regulator
MGVLELNKIVKSKKALMDSLVYLIAEKPIHSIKITEICELASCNRSTFYSQYDSKEELVEEVLKYNVNKLHIVLDLVAIDIHRKSLYEALLPLFQFIYDHRYFYNIILGDYKISGFRQQLFDSYKFTIAKKIAKEIEEFQGDRTLQEIQLNQITSTWLGVALYWVHQSEDMSVEFVTKEYIKILSLQEHAILMPNWRFKRRKTMSSKQKKASEAFQVALIELLEQMEFKQIKIQHILDTAVYNRTTFYQNFKDKEDLLRSMENRFLDGMLLSMTNRNITQLQKESTVNALMDYFYDNRHFLKVMYSKRMIPGFFNRMFKVLIQFFEEELANQEIKIDLGLYSNFLTNTIMAVVGGWFTHEIRYSPEFMGKILLKLITE